MNKKRQFVRITEWVSDISTLGHVVNQILQYEDSEVINIRTGKEGLKAVYVLDNTDGEYCQTDEESEVKSSHKDV